MNTSSRLNKVILIAGPTGSGKTGVAIEIAKEIVPSLTVESTKKAIAEKDVDLSVNHFAEVLAKYVKSKDDI